MSNWQTENLKGAITLADSTIRSLILVNGAAAGGLLTFYGNHTAEYADVNVRLALHGSLISFGTGVFVAIVCAIFSYLAQRGIATNSGPKVEFFLTIPAITAALFSAGEFGNGLYLASAALK